MRILLFSLFYLLLLNVSWADTQSTQDYFDLKLYQSAAKRLESALIEGPEAFVKERNKIKKEFFQQSSKYYFYWTKRLDEQFIANYLTQVLEVWALLPPNHIGHTLREQFLQGLKDKTIHLSWLVDHFYYREQYGQGVTHVEDRSITLDTLSPENMHALLAHELTHLFDQDLIDARLNLDLLENESITLLLKPINSWTPTEKESFARFWFIKDAYLKYDYKELKPRINACLVFTDLVKTKAIHKPNDKLLQRYAKVLQDKTTCYDQAFKELGLDEVKPKLFWSPYSQEGVMERTYLESWLNHAMTP